MWFERRAKTSNEPDGPNDDDVRKRKCLCTPSVSLQLVFFMKSSSVCQIRYSLFVHYGCACGEWVSETSQRRKKHVEAENCPAIIASVHYVSKESRCRLLFEERYVCVRPQSRNVFDRRAEPSWWLQEWTWQDLLKIVTHTNTHAATALFYSIFAFSITRFFFLFRVAVISHSRENIVDLMCTK